MPRGTTMSMGTTTGTATDAGALGRPRGQRIRLILVTPWTGVLVTGGGAFGCVTGGCQSDARRVRPGYRLRRGVWPAAHAAHRPCRVMSCAST